MLIEIKEISSLQKILNVILRATARRIYEHLGVDSSLFTLALNGYDFVLHPLLAWLRMTKSKECKLGSLAQH